MEIIINMTDWLFVGTTPVNNSQLICLILLAILGIFSMWSVCKK